MTACVLCYKPPGKHLPAFLICLVLHTGELQLKSHDADNLKADIEPVGCFMQERHHVSQVQGGVMVDGWLLEF